MRSHRVDFRECCARQCDETLLDRNLRFAGDPQHGMRGKQIVHRGDLSVKRVFVGQDRVPDLTCVECFDDLRECAEPARGNVAQQRNDGVFAERSAFALKSRAHRALICRLHTVPCGTAAGPT